MCLVNLLFLVRFNLVNTRNFKERKGKKMAITTFQEILESIESLSIEDIKTYLLEVEDE
jgi:hypothetical protein